MTSEWLKPARLDISEKARAALSSFGTSARDYLLGIRPIPVAYLYESAVLTSMATTLQEEPLFIARASGLSPISDGGQRDFQEYSGGYIFAERSTRYGQSVHPGL